MGQSKSKSSTQQATTTCAATCDANGRRCAAPKNHDGLHDFIGVPHPAVEVARFADLADAADAYAADPEGYSDDTQFVIGPGNTRANRFYLGSAKNDDDCESLEALLVPERGGRCYSISDLLNDPSLRTAIKRTAAARRLVEDTLSRAGVRT